MRNENRNRFVLSKLLIVRWVLAVLCFSFFTVNAQDYKLKKIINLYEIPAFKDFSAITDIMEDRSGFVWIGTQNGLYKFDGYELTHFSFDPNHPEKIAGNWISTLAEDDSGNIWFGIFGIGVQKFDPVTEKFALYRADPLNKDSLSNDRIQHLAYHDNKLWVATQAGVCALLFQTGKFKQYSTDYCAKFLVSAGKIWAIVDNKLVSFDKVADSLVSFYEISYDLGFGQRPEFASGNKLYLLIGEKMFVLNLITKVLLPLYLPTENAITASLSNGQSLLMTDTKNIISLDLSSEKFTVAELRANINRDDLGLSKFIRLKNNDVWAVGNKIYKIIDGQNGIESFELLKNGKPFVPMSTLTEREKGLMGIGEGLYLDFFTATITRAESKYPFLKRLPDSSDFMSQYLRVYMDEKGDSWIAEFNRHIQDNKGFEVSIHHFSQSKKTLETLGGLKSGTGPIFGITKIGDELWIAGWTGLVRWNIPSSKETFINSGNDSTLLSSVGVRYLFKDRDEGLWIATQNGLNYKRKNDNTFKKFVADEGNTNSISFNSISTITQDPSGAIWVGTIGGGANKLDPKTGKFNWYTREQGLPNNNVANIVIDKEANIWVSHDEGVSRINHQTHKIENFSKPDGTGHFQENSAIAMRDSSLIFVGDVIARIWPSRLINNEFNPNICITGFKVHNKKILINGPDSVLHQDIHVTKSLKLNHYQNVISFQYAALDMANAEQRSYAYQLVGFDTGWQYVDKKREVTFMNLTPGEYELKIKSANQNGQWHEMPNPLFITILPPWWRTWWAYTLYVIGFVLALWWFIRFRSRQLKKENLRLEEKVNTRTDELQKSLHELKVTQNQLVQREKMASLGELTAGIAHEIQNPLNFVNNFSEVNSELIAEMKLEIQKGNLHEVKALAVDIEENEVKINHHGKRADAIVKGMLQHSRISTGHDESTDINALVDEYLRLSFHGLRAKDKSFNAIIQTDFDNSIGKINIIPQDIGRVLLNLYNNAFYAVAQKQKQLGEGYKPSVTVTTKKALNHVEIFITDNGDGIPQKITDKIFQPFFTTKPTGEGTGLGLSLSYDIVKAHGGAITLESKEGDGAVFTIQLPLKQL